MGRKRRQHYEHIPVLLESYCAGRTLDFQRYSEFHLRLMDGGYTVLDVWTTGRYYILTTDYLSLLGAHTMIERAGEKGVIPTQNEADLFAWLDTLFFPTEAQYNSRSRK